MKVFSVTELNRVIKNLIDNEIVLEDVMVTGELSSFSITRGIAYFTLKDNENLLNCVQFKATQDFSVGDMVQLRGNVKYYPKGGKLTFNALTIELCGQGELYKQFIELKNRLQQEGLFDEANKIPIPKYINSIGVVTSKTGAVLQDIKNVSWRRNPNLEIQVYDAQVQGRFAVSDVIAGITYFDNMTDVDVIIVARGGGSLEDLFPFNDEELARVAFICNKPLISAVGHETDFSILDFVADLRAPTPSAAAELVSFDAFELRRYVSNLQTGLDKNVGNLLVYYNSQINYYIDEINGDVNLLINDEILHLHKLINIYDNSIERMINDTMHSVDISLNTLNKLNPAHLLQIGYASVTNQKNENIRHSNIDVGDMINIVSSDVKLEAEVKSKEKL